MKDIVNQRGLSMRDATEMVEDYSRARRYALDHHKEPVPTFGHVMEVVKWKIEAQKRAAGTLVFKEAARLTLEREKGKAMREQMGGEAKVILSQKAKVIKKQEEPESSVKKFPGIKD
jgi:hypothetical protein